jgi:hypothetical protein
MTEYEELCQAYFAGEPHRVAVDAIVRGLPQMLRQALNDCLRVPTGPAAFATIVAGTPMPYVALYRARFDRNGTRQWEASPSGEELQFDADGIGHFTIGICVEQEHGAIPASMICLEFTLETVEEQSAVFQLARTGKSITVNLANSPAGYAAAAKTIIEYLLDNLRNPEGPAGLRGPLGF